MHVEHLQGRRFCENNVPAGCQLVAKFLRCGWGIGGIGHRGVGLYSGLKNGALTDLHPARARVNEAAIVSHDGDPTHGDLICHPMWRQLICALVLHPHLGLSRAGASEPSG